MPVTHSSQRMRAVLNCVRVPFESMVTTLKPIRSISREVFQKSVPEPLPSAEVNVIATFSTNCAQTSGFWSAFGTVGQLSQTSPKRSKS